MKCPVCDVTLSISSREGVEIDFCPQCRGVWLDRGELDKIIDRVATSQAPPPREERREQRRSEPSRYDQPRYDEPAHRHDDRPRYDDDYWKKKHKKKKAKSFIEDIFDF